MLYFHKSFNIRGCVVTNVSFACIPRPPNIHRLPLLSAQPCDQWREEGHIVSEGTPLIPFLPRCHEIESPPIQAHSFVDGMYFHRSLSMPVENAPQRPVPPNNH